MKKILISLLSTGLLLTGCSSSSKIQETVTEKNSPDSTIEAIIQDEDTEIYDPTKSEETVKALGFTGLDDDSLLSYIEDYIYEEAIKSLSSDEYIVENVNAVYLSQEYIEELEYNSKVNVFFGYTLSELEEQFGGARYIFTLGDDGETTVKELETVSEDVYATAIKNVAIGSGVILVCVTVSVVAPIVGAPVAVTAIFSASATGATTFALNSGALGAVSAGLAKAYQTGDVDEALKAAAEAGGNGFKWGAISGALVGGGKEALILNSGTANGLTMSEVATIQKETGYPMDVISQFHSLDEYSVYKEAGLKTLMIDGKITLVQDIDINFISEKADGTEITNLERMMKGQAPIDPVTGKAYELHHIGQSDDSTLAILNWQQHRGEGNFSKVHEFLKGSDVDHGAEWTKTTSKFWKSLANYYVEKGV